MEDHLAEEQQDWASLPRELLEIIGNNLSFDSGVDLANASLVCKSWKENIVSGLTSMDLDMHCDPTIWQAKLAKLCGLLRCLSRAVIHINTAIEDELLIQNVGLLQQLQGITELDIRLREGCDLPPPAAEALGGLRHLRTLRIVGGSLNRVAVGALLRALARFAGDGAAAGTSGLGPPRAHSGDGGGGLRSLTLLPAAQSGLGDDDVPLLLAAGEQLECLEFRACRLTSAGLVAMSHGLPRLKRLAISSLDSDSGYELACLERLSVLSELNLSLDHAQHSRNALCALKPGKDLSLSFKWTDRAHGLLRDCGESLANLTRLDMGACRVSTEAVFEAVAQLTGLKELRMAVYSNADHSIPCHLSRLANLAALRRFHLEKRRAYFPEARRFCESSIRVPLTAGGLQALAGRWGQLTSLRLALSGSDFSSGGLAALSGFAGLKELGLIVDRAAAAVASGTAAAPPAAATAGPGSDGLPGGGSGSFDVGLPTPRLDLACLPAGLTSLELGNLSLELSMPNDSFLASALLCQLESLDMESCVVRSPVLLQLLCAKLGGSLRSLRLVDVVGLSDAGLAGLGALTELRSLTVSAPGNRAVSQSSLSSLSTLRALRHMSWESDDLTANGPQLSSLASFTSLRYLWLSCSERTAARALQAAAAAAAAVAAAPMVPAAMAADASAVGVDVAKGDPGGDAVKAEAPPADGAPAPVPLSPRVGPEDVAAALGRLQAALPYCFVDMVPSSTI